jgi:hypothetical protein
VNSSPNLYCQLAQYIKLLSEGLRLTHRAEERGLYMQHLADAALLFQTMQDGDAAAFRVRIEEAQRTYGTSWLSGNEGASAEAAFHEFVRNAEK